MLRPETNSYHPCRDSAEHCKFFKQSRWQWRSHLPGRIEEASEEMLVHEDLCTLGEVGGPFPPVLNGAKVIKLYTAFPQLLPQDICCRDGVLNCEIDAHTAYG